jgi:hydroxyethylthiazole kinase
VVMNYTANALLACGASPVMAHAPEEVEEMVSFAGALVLNIGTLSREWIESMVKAGRRANERNIPIILDPVGSGATTFRTESSKRLMGELAIRVIRGNASEVLSLAHEGSRTKGVDSLHNVEEAADAARTLAAELKTTLAITGAVDLVTDGTRTFRVHNGHPFMGYVTGTGCTATVMTGAFLAIERDSVEATAMALAYFGLAGERAAARTAAPGAFQISLLDELYLIRGEDLRLGAKIQK